MIAGVLTDVLLLVTEHADDALTEVAVGDLDVVLGGTSVVHQGQEVVVSDVQLHKKVSVCAISPLS